MYRISKVKTGRQIRRLLKEHGVAVREIQDELNLESPQAIYKWLNGKSLPSTENLLSLAKLLRLPMETLLVLEEEDEYEAEQNRLWQKNHPPVWMGYRAWEYNPIRKADAERLSLFIEDLAQERMRIITCAN